MLTVFKKLKEILSPPTLITGHPTLRESFPSLDGSAEEKTRRDNEVAIAEANFKFQREALQKNLNLVYASFMVSLLAFTVSILALIFAITKNY